MFVRKKWYFCSNISYKRAAMKINILLIAAIIVSVLASCGSDKKDEPTDAIGTSTKIEGDSTLYGLACEGCTDSVVIMLPGDCSDPVTYDIIEAMKNGRVLGRMETGAWICLTLDTGDDNVAYNVINLDQLKGTWVQSVMPTLRELNGAMIEQDAEAKAMRDSIIEKLMVPCEIGFALKRYYTAEPVGMTRQNSADNMSPVIYPTPKRYNDWHIFNGRLVLTEAAMAADSAANDRQTADGDTADILLLTRDSLALRFLNGEVRGYHRK